MSAASRARSLLLLAGLLLGSATAPDRQRLSGRGRPPGGGFRMQSGSVPGIELREGEEKSGIEIVLSPEVTGRVEAEAVLE